MIPFPPGSVIIVMLIVCALRSPNRNDIFANCIYFIKAVEHVYVTVLFKLNYLLTIRLVQT